MPIGVTAAQRPLKPEILVRIQNGQLGRSMDSPSWSVMPPILNHDGAYPLPSGRLIRPALRRSDGYSSIVQRQNVRLLIGKSLVRIQLEERNKFFACSQGRASYRGLAKRSGNGLQNRTGGFDSRNHVASGTGVDWFVGAGDGFAGVAQSGRRDRPRICFLRVRVPPPARCRPCDRWSATVSASRGHWHTM